MSDTDKVFAGSVPEIYETHLVPLIFEPYAADLVDRLSSRSPSRVLEIAAGTGVVTRALASRLGDGASIVATDLNQAMLDQASAVGTKRKVEWRRADATQLPFTDGSFDAVVCQFGVMFFPDKPKAFSEALRVLSPGGVFIFNVWDRIEENEFADTVTTALASVFPEDLPRPIARSSRTPRRRARSGRPRGGASHHLRRAVPWNRHRRSAPRVPRNHRASRVSGRTGHHSRMHGNIAAGRSAGRAGADVRYHRDPCSGGCGRGARDLMLKLGATAILAATPR